MRNWKLSQAQRASVELERRRRIALAPRHVLLPHQRPPDGDWLRWILLSGRGGGKTFAAAHYVDQYARGNANARLAIIAPTLGDARKTCVEGVTGLMSFNSQIKFNRSWGELEWPNGAKGTLFGAHTPDDAERLRGPQHHLAWFEEMAAARQLEDSWTNMRLGLRLGNRPHVVISTTPKPRALLKQLLADPGTVVTRATTAQNPHLAESVRTELYRLYENTRIGRQELGAEILEEIEGAIWNYDLIEQHRVSKAPDLERIVVAMDPAGTGKGNHCGIVVAGLASDHVYVLADYSILGSADAQIQRAINVYHDWKADRLLVEANQGQDWIRSTLTSKDRTVAYAEVWAHRGKALRAGPVHSYYERGLVHHVGCFRQLEDEMCSWVPGDDSPDRLDAMVHAVTHLGRLDKNHVFVTAI